MSKNKVKLPHYGQISFYIDENNQEEIFNFLAQKGKGNSKLQIILHKITNKVVTKDEYSKEEYTHNIKNVTAIKLKGKRFNNARIYCKDYLRYDGKRIIVLSELLKSKKQNDLTYKEKTLINKVNSYEYE